MMRMKKQFFIIFKKVIRKVNNKKEQFPKIFLIENGLRKEDC